MTSSPGSSPANNQSIIACGQSVDIGTPVVLWTDKKGYVCPNKRGRKDCTQHDPVLNDQPTLADSYYRINDPQAAYEELQETVHQFILHYDVCYCSWQCHQLMQDSTFKGSQFYLDLDGTIYQTCDLYWKTNTGPADDRIGNERSVHVEMANLSWEALKQESDLYQVTQDQYQKIEQEWQFMLPETYRDKLKTPDFKAIPARFHKTRGYFSRKINGRMVRMWDFTEEQYQALIKLCLGIHRLLPKIKLAVPYDIATRKVPLDRIQNFSSFSGVLGHCHIQHGGVGNLKTKYDPGSSFNWSRLRKVFLQASGKTKRV
jgi:N-acetylmuramoyl-L-alanine amidase